MKSKKITGFKGFDKDLKCRDFQYQIGKTYLHKGNIACCQNGFHFCENPMDVFNYYPPTSRFAKVEGSGKMDKEANGDSKIACSKLNVKSELSLKSLTDFGVKFILDKVDWTNAKESNTDYQSAATNTGDQSAATNTGDRSAATNTGDQSAATNTGDQSAATNTGDRSAATNTGDQSAATNTGYRSAAIVEGKESIACGLGIENKAKGKKGCWLVLSEWEIKNDKWHIKDVQSVKIDGKIILADTFYMLKDGVFTIA